MAYSNELNYVQKVAGQNSDLFPPLSLRHNEKTVIKTFRPRNVFLSVANLYDFLVF